MYIIIGDALLVHTAKESIRNVRAGSFRMAKIVPFDTLLKSKPVTSLLKALEKAGKGVKQRLSQGLSGKPNKLMVTVDELNGQSAALHDIIEKIPEWTLTPHPATFSAEVAGGKLWIYKENQDWREGVLFDIHAGQTVTNKEKMESEPVEAFLKDIRMLAPETDDLYEEHSNRPYVWWFIPNGKNRATTKRAIMNVVKNHMRKEGSRWWMSVPGGIVSLSYLKFDDDENHWVLLLQG